MKNRPNVLLLGNGPVCIDNNHSWINCIDELCKMRGKIGTDLKNVPNSVKGLLFANSELESRREEYLKIFKDSYQYHESELVKEITMLPNIDAILTTQYTYDYEYPIIQKNNVFEYIKKHKKTIRLNNNKLNKQIIGQNNNLCDYIYNNNSNIKYNTWHIHGEIRKPDSIVFSLDEYEKNVKSIIMYYNYRYKNLKNYDTNFEYKTWVDYFLFGNVYCVGLMFDFAETDLWWLMGKRNELGNKVGDFVYYYMKSDTTKYIVNAFKCFDSMKIKTKNLGFNYCKHLENSFYKKAIVDIAGTL